MKEDEVVINVRTGGGLGEAYFIAYYKKGQIHGHLFGGGPNGFCTMGYFSEDSSVEKIIRKTIEKHFEPRIYEDLKGNIEKCDPIYDSEELYPEAMQLRRLLEERLTGQQVLFEDAV